MFDCVVGPEPYSLLVQHYGVDNSPWGDRTGDVLGNARTQAARLPSFFMGPIDADAPGVGYVTQEDEPVMVWVCNERITQVRFLREAPKERDTTGDAVNLLVSMLPWACGEQPPPLDDADA